MKSIKYMMVAVLVACTMLSLAESGRATSRETKKVMDISLQSAMKIPGLVMVMYQHLDPSFLSVDKEVYEVYIRYQFTTYRIFGTRDEWVRFFKLKLKFPSNANVQMGTN